MTYEFWPPDKTLIYIRKIRGPEIKILGILAVTTYQDKRRLKLHSVLHMLKSFVGRTVTYTKFHSS